MRLSIRARLAYRFDEASEVLLLLEAARSRDQSVLSDTLTLSVPGDIARLDDAVTGERRAVFTAAGDVSIRYDAQVEVPPRDGALAGAPAAAIRDLPGEALRYLMASRYCPSDRFESFVEREFAGVDGGDKVLAILDWIHTHVDYRPGVSDAGTTARDTFVDRAGVCRDFAHLAITLCRAAGIPARAVSAYAWGLTPPDMHAVAEVFVGGRWRMIDATRRAPLDGLVRVAIGLDAIETAFMTIFGKAELVAQSFEVDALTA